MRIIKKNKIEYLILGVFLVWSTIDIFSFFLSYQFAIDLSCSIIFVILFDFSLRYSKNKKARYKSLTKAMYLYGTLLIAPIAVSYYHDLPFNLNGLEVVNIVLPIQSIIYLFYNEKMKLKSDN